MKITRFPNVLRLNAFMINKEGTGGRGELPSRGPENKKSRTFRNAVSSGISFPEKAWTVAICNNHRTL